MRQADYMPVQGGAVKVCERIASIRRKPRNRPSVDGDAPDRFELGFGEAGAAFGRAALLVVIRPGYVLARVAELLLGARGVDLGDQHHEFGPAPCKLGREPCAATADAAAVRDGPALSAPNTAPTAG